MTNDKLIIELAGSSKLELVPGHYCGKKWGFGIRFENWICKPSFHGSDGFAAGGVLGFDDVETIYKAMKAYTKKHKRMKLSEIYK